MSNTVIQVSSDLIHSMKKHYADSLLEKIPPGAVFAAKHNSCSITAYRSGKVMFQGKMHAEEAMKWGKPSDPPAKRKTSGSPLPPNISRMSLIGSDEVGTGDYFGPITVVSAYVKKEQIPLLKELGVKDSKDLSDIQIIKIAKDLLHVIPYSLLLLRNEKYNKLQASGMTQGKMKALLHNQALNNLLKKITPETPEAILIDQFVEADTYYRHLKGQAEIVKENVFFSTKGESVHIAVAAASILARYAFVKSFDDLSNEAEFTLPKGAGHQVDQAAAKLIKQKGEAALYKYAKVHFANTEKAKKLI
ncbi:ribonuclease HIII [Heyndrickxia sp. NPDC080065]|uniref:ribonuclease HIII n=1 Tax=Heyndrickxia sp. NPDC080065 TaxID=3390568 RepID=UPI003D059A35